MKMPSRICTVTYVVRRVLLSKQSLYKMSKRKSVSKLVCYSETYIKYSTACFCKLVAMCSSIRIVAWYVLKKPIKSVYIINEANHNVLNH